MNQEEAFVKSFIVKGKQDRYVHLLSSKTHRNKILDTFNHNLSFNPEHAELIAANCQSSKQVHAILLSKGAVENCYVISDKLEWDAREMSLEKALDLIVGSSIGTVICCVSGKLAYYESEDLKLRYIFQTKEKST